jgi:hypothetical protein
MKKFILSPVFFALFFIAPFFGTLSAFCQSVIIDPSVSGGSNIISASAPNKASQLPRVANSTNIATPQAGQLIYNQSTASPNFYNGTSWQNMNGGPLPSNTFPNSVFFGDPESPKYSGTGSQWDSYTWTVPAGVTKIWVEMWSGGGSGSIFNNSFAWIDQTGGDSGGYLSTIIPVSSGIILTIYVAKGKNISQNPTGISSIILDPTGTLLSNTGISFSKRPSASLINFSQRNIGQENVFENYVSFTDDHLEYAVKGGNGGDAPYGGKGGKSINNHRSVNSNGTVDVNNGIYNSSINTDGIFPGGGGGRGYNFSGSGANGFVIIHY